MRSTLIRGLYLTAGLLFVLLAIIGVVLPLLPTTPFLLVAAFCFSRSSETLHQYLLNHRLFGHLIREWEAHGVIPFKIKILSTTLMIAMISYPLLFLPIHPGLKALAAGTVIFALWYIWSRPSEPPAYSTTRASSEPTASSNKLS